MMQKIIQRDIINQGVAVVEKSKKTYQHGSRFDEETEADFNFIKEYNKENFIDTDDSAILRTTVRYYAKFLRGKIRKD